MNYTHLDAALEVLRTRCTGSGWRTDMERIEPYTRAEVPAVNIRLRTEQNTNRPLRPFDALTAAVQVDLDIQTRAVELGVKSAGQIDAEMHRSIMQDPTLGGKVLQVFRVGTEWDTAAGDAVPQRRTVRLEIHYATRAGDIALQT